MVRAPENLYEDPHRGGGLIPRSELALAAMIGLFYFFARYGIFERLDQVAWWASYLFEAAFCAGVAFYYRKRVRFDFAPDLTFCKHALGTLVMGALIAMGLRTAQVPIPFDLADGRTTFIILNVAPAIEEGVFRLALWIPMALLFARRNPVVLLAVNSALFSAVHLYSLTLTGEEYVPFVLVQSLYVIGLAAACGWWMLRTSSILYAIAIHYAFNLGFYLVFAL